MFPILPMDLPAVLQWFLCFSMALFSVITADFLTTSSSGSITLNSSGDATLDTPIWFTATYRDFKEDDDLVYEWWDDLWNRHQEPMLTDQSNWSMIYDTRTYEYYTGIRKVTVKVKKKWSYWTIASANIHFHLSRYLNGELQISQTNVSILTPGYISTGNPTNLTAFVDDPNDWMKKRTIFATFYWVINNMIVATCDTPSLLINLTEPQDYYIQANVYLALASEIITTTPATTTTTSTVATTHLPTTLNQTTIATSPRSGSSTQQQTTTSAFTTVTTAIPPPPNNRTWICSGWWPNSRRGGNQGERNYGVSEINIRKFATFSKSTKAKEPIGTLNVTGSQWLKRGQLLNLTVQCSGSGSWTYCFSAHAGYYNVTGNEICPDREPLVTTVCDFKLIHFFKSNGTFSYLIIITNEVSKQIQAVPITIYNVDHKHQLSYIIIPVSCSLVVIIIIIFGSAFLLQSRKRYLVEVADFDFVMSDDVMYNKTMCELLQEAFEAALFTKTDELEDDDIQWRDSSRIIECPRILESGYGTFDS